VKRGRGKNRTLHLRRGLARKRQPIGGESPSERRPQSFEGGSTTTTYVWNYLLLGEDGKHKQSAI